MNKAFYKSKTLWVNIIAIVAIVMGKEQFDATLSAQILAGINIVLRFVTKQPIDWN